jgi:hypothetical protein
MLCSDYGSSPMVAAIRNMYIAKDRSDRRKSLIGAIASMSAVVATAYVAVGLTSLAEVSVGINHVYSTFWHGPWRALFQILGLI